MEKELFEDEIDRCLATISDELYNFHDEIVNLLSLINQIYYVRQMQEQESKKLLSNLNNVAG